MARDDKPSKITVPRHAHPHARLVFALMKEHRKTYDDVEHESGVLRSTLKSYRNEKTPSLQSIEALLGCFGWTLVPVPPLDSLPEQVRDQLEDVGMGFRSDEETMGAIVATLARQAAQKRDENGPSPLARGRSYWKAAAA